MEYDNSIEERMKCSFFSLLSTTERDIQTSETFFKRMQMLDKELEEREIPRPVVICLDNHESHHDEATKQFCLRRGIRLHFEPPNTSAFLQALDQYNRMLHKAYHTEVKRWKKRNGEKALSLKDFIDVVLTIWPWWASPLDRRESFRLVGLESGGLKPQNVNRTSFIVRAPTPEQALQRVATEVLSPVDLRKGSVAFWREKCKTAQNIIAKLKEIPLLPDEAGLVDVEETEQEKSRRKKRRVRHSYGSQTLRELAKAAAQVEAKAVEEEHQKTSRAAKKKEVHEQLEKAFERCEHTCTCGVQPCPLAKYARCEFCGKICCRKCTKKACKERRDARVGQKRSRSRVIESSSDLASQMTALLTHANSRLFLGKVDASVQDAHSKTSYSAPALRTAVYSGPCGSYSGVGTYING
eukprot:scaffold1307_cov200-Pinguiococcus_pyrenoidosus.AAC.59